MSDIPGSDATKSMEQQNDNLSIAMENLSVTTAENSDNSSPPKSFSDMPLDVVGLFIENLDYKEQLILRKVCKSLRALVDKQKPACTRLNFWFEPNRINFIYNQKSVYYATPRCLEIEHRLAEAKKEGNIKLIVSDDFEKIALDDLASTLKNPKLQLETFTFHSHTNDYEHPSKFAKRFNSTMSVFESIGHQISAKKCDLSTDQPFEYHLILPYFKPGVLETIKICVSLKPTPEAMKQISLLDQWKQAEKLELIDGLNSFPFEYATHFKRFYFVEMSYVDEHLIRLRNFASTSEKFEHCLAVYYFAIPAQAIHMEFGQPAPGNDRTEYVSHYSIPNSNDYLEFMFFKQTIKIRKIKKEKQSIRFS